MRKSVIITVPTLIWENFPKMVLLRLTLVDKLNSERFVIYTAEKQEETHSDNETRARLDVSLIKLEKDDEFWGKTP